MVSPAKPRIALVEDDPEIAHYVSLLLRARLSAEVTHYADGLDGLVGILSSPPDLAVLDLELPGLRGEEICRRLRTSPVSRDLPIVICSSMPEPQKRELELLRIGADAYLEKPFPEERFLETVGTLLAAGRSAVAEDTTEDAPLRRRAGASVHEEDVTEDSTRIPPLPAREPTPVSPEAGAPKPASVFAGYLIGPILGGGGMGTVYRAFDPQCERDVALKVLLRSLTGIPQAVERFLREGRIMASLEHPNIVRIYDSGRTAYSYYIAMELIEGLSLDERLEEDDHLRWPEQVRITEQILDAVVYLHSRGVLHRDLKPSNILLTDEGVAKLGDFGISRADALAGEWKLTRDPSLVGTPSFMAPEQFQGVEATVATDLYALGRTLQTLFEGQRPALPPRPLHEARPDLPRSLSDALSRCARLDPAQRFQTAEEARDAILAACAEKE